MTPGDKRLAGGARLVAGTKKTGFSEDGERPVSPVDAAIPLSWSLGPVDR
jgi:hypothetical protein